MMNGQFIPSSHGDKKTPDKPTKSFLSEDISYSYESLNEFQVKIQTEDGRTTSLIFERHWIGDWKLSGLKMPQ